MRVQDEQLVREAAQAGEQGVHLSGGLQLIEAAEAMAHPLDHAAVHPLVLDEEQVGAIAVLLGADEHGELCHPIIADSTYISSDILRFA